MGKDLGRVPAHSISSPLPHPPASLYPHTISGYLRKPQICCHGEHHVQSKPKSNKRAKRPLRKVTSSQFMIQASTSFTNQPSMCVRRARSASRTHTAGESSRTSASSARGKVQSNLQSNLHRSTWSTPCFKPVPVTHGHVPFRPVSHSNF